MSELFDEFLKKKGAYGKFEYITVKANNCANLYFESDKDLWMVNDFPRLASPFKKFVIDFDFPEKICHNKSFTINKDFQKVSVMVNEITYDGITTIYETMNIKGDSSVFSKSDEGNRKFCLTGICKSYDGNLYSFISIYELDNDYNVRFADSDTPRMIRSSLELISEDINAVMMFRNRSTLIGLENSASMVTIAFIYPTFLTISLMNCKNVGLKENNPMDKVPNRIKKHWNKKGIEPLKKFYTLEIEPLKQKLKTEGNIEENGFKKALHICRGHFKDYSKGNGLFGKYKGLYWCEMHTRGSIENGEIIKDYNVKI